MRYLPIPPSIRCRRREVRKRDPCYRKQHAINVPDAQAALDGAREILASVCETAKLLGKLRARLWEQGIVTSTVMKGKETARKKNSVTTPPIPRPYTLSPRIAPSRCSSVRPWASEDRTGFPEEIETTTVPHPSSR